VRDDLQAAGPGAAAKSLITDNLLRRHLSALVRARCIMELVELEQDGRRSSQEAVKARVPQQLGLARRATNRDPLLLATPLPVQRACDRGELGLIGTGKVALLGDEVQREIAQRIERGEKAGKVVSEYIAARDAGSANVDRSLERMLTTIQREAPRLRERRDEIGDGLLQRALPDLREAHTVLAEIIEWAEEAS